MTNAHAEVGPGAGPTKFCAVPGQAKSWLLGKYLHLSYEYLLTFSNLEAWKWVGAVESGRGKSEVVLFATVYDRVPNSAKRHRL